MSSFLSLSEKIVAAFLSLGFKKRFREVVWGRRVVRHTREVGGVRAALTTPCSWAPSLKTKHLLPSAFYFPYDFTEYSPSQGCFP